MCPGDGLSRGWPLPRPVTDGTDSSSGLEHSPHRAASTVTPTPAAWTSPRWWWGLPEEPQSHQAWVRTQQELYQHWRTGGETTTHTRARSVALFWSGPPSWSLRMVLAAVRSPGLEWSHKSRSWEPHFTSTSRISSVLTLFLTFSETRLLPRGSCCVKADSLSQW